MFWLIEVLHFGPLLSDCRGGKRLISSVPDSPYLSAGNILWATKLTFGSFPSHFGEESCTKLKDSPADIGSLNVSSIMGLQGKDEHSLRSVLQQMER